MYSKLFREIADNIDNLRLEIYSGLHLNIDNADDKSELDDMLFSIQSKLRYEVVEILQCYEEWIEEMFNGRIYENKI